ncbi:MAG: DMT family transporter, partial [Pirellulales bacterium]|nr:DMT family transporter [Pirellulales bacterium]
MPYVAFLFICLCWGTSFILMDRAALAFSPVEIGMGRMACGALTIAVYCLAMRRWAPLTRSDLLKIALVAALSNAFPYVAQPLVMELAGEHGFFGMMVTLVPIATIVASAVMLNQWPSPRQWLGVLGGLACAALIVADGSARGMHAWLLLLAISTQVAYAFGNTFIKWQLSHLPSAPLATLFLGLGALTLLPVELAVPLRPPLSPLDPSPHQWALGVASLAVLGVGSTGIAILAFVHLIQTQGPLFAGMVTYVVPVIALAWGQLDGERLTGRQLAAIAGVLAMVALV